MAKTTETNPALSRRKRRQVRRYLLGALFSGLILIVVAGALFYKMTGQHLPFFNTEHAAQKLDTNAFPSAGTISFTGPDSQNPSVNPTRAAIDDIAFKTVSVTWQIRDAKTDEIIDGGPGSEITDELLNLETAENAGDYIVDFFCADQNYKIYGNSASFSTGG